jgi:transposase
VGPVPKQNSSGGKLRLGNISKQGDRYLRSLFTTYFNRRMVEQHGLNLATMRQAITAMLDKRPVPLLSAT